MMIKRFSAIVIVFSIISITRDVDGTINLDIINELVAPENPELNRVRRMEDADGDPFAVLDTVGLVEKYGYPAEQHNVTTEDGYDIVFFRIPGGPKSLPTTGKPMVFLQHGLFLSSDSWVLMGPSNDLAFLLADAGYDVWIGNVRGNTYARSHKRLTTLDKEFWNFSFDEIGAIDTVSLIDYALEYTGEKKFFYIGHSMGTVISYVMLTERPEYNDKVRLVVSLAPAAFWEYYPGPFLRLLAQNSPLIEALTDSLGIYNFFPQSRTIAEFIRVVCGDDSPMLDVCLSIFHFIDGQPAAGFNNSALPSLFQYFPAGTSRKTAFHFFQSINAGTSSNKKFDYGPVENLRKYGTRTPPDYDLSKITAPVALFYGQTDELVQAPNIIGLSKHFSNLVTCESVPSPVFSHMDFIWSRQAKDILYPRIIELLSKYSN